MRRPRILLAEDNPLMADQIRELLEPSFEIVGVVASGEELESAYESLVPEAVVTDIAMPGEGGLVAARKILERHPGVPVVMLTVIDALLMIRLSLSSGVRGYVVKEDAGEELVPALRAAMDQRQYISAAGRRNMPQ